MGRERAISKRPLAIGTRHSAIGSRQVEEGGYALCMGILQQPIQRKLSSLLGAQVTFEKLNVSLIGGSIDAAGVTVAGDDPGEPLLTVGRARVEIAVGRALRGEIVVKSITIENPVLSVIHHEDGSTNLPRSRVVEDEPPAETQTPEPAEARPTDEEGAAEESKWKFDVRKVLLVDGELHFRSRRLGGYHLSARRVLAELTRGEGRLGFTVIAESVGRRDQPSELGVFKASGALTGVADLTKAAEAGLKAQVELGEQLRADVDSAALKSRELGVRADGNLDLRAILPLLPGDVRRLLDALRGNARLALTARARLSPRQGVQIEDLSLRASDLILRAGAAGEVSEPRSG